MDLPAFRAAVAHAARSGGKVTPLFVLDDRLLRPSGPNRVAVMYEALRALRNAGIPLEVATGDPVEVVPLIAHRCGAQVFATADFAPYGSSRDGAVQTALEGVGSTLNLVDSPYLVPPGTVRKGDGTPFRVFTPFKRVWLDHARGQRPHSPERSTSALQAVPWSNQSGRGTASVDIPVSSAQVPSGLPVMTESAAWAAADAFFDTRVSAYGETRNLPALDATSRLSPYLKYGLLHPRQLLGRVEELVDAGDVGAAMFLSELCWREFYADVLFNRPESARSNYIQTMEIETDSGPLADDRFDAWCAGRTGYPFIDAGMRQLLAEGWMHNRVRMAVASFLVKDLHLPWQRGARWFMRQLVDGDIASNQHGWQWTAGTGTDAAPYFRIFNPITQGKKFDPDGAYIKRWVPELASLSKTAVHEPWLHCAPRQLFDLPAAASSSSGSSGVDSYPAPIVDHAAERDESMRRFRVVRAAVSVTSGLG